MSKVPLPQIILGMNSRNFRLIKAVNYQFAINRVNSKIRFKKLLAKNDVGTPEIYDVVSNFKDLSEIPWAMLEEKSFVIKPDRGFGGHGIIVLGWNKKRRIWMKGSREYSRENITRHLRDILDGQYSKGYLPDRAFFEERVRPHKFFRQLSSSGLPDIRVIVYNSVPLMAMLRLPTVESGGRSNLHAGGLGVGIDIGSGITTHTIYNGGLIAQHPDTAMRLADLKIPKWNKVLQTAIEAQRISGLGYSGVDIVIDSVGRVMILEANARPGLDIQIANLAGLNERVVRVRNLKVRSAEHGMRVANELFSEFDGSKVRSTKKPILKRIESVEIINPANNKSIRIKAKIDTGADSSSIGITVARRLGFGWLVKEIRSNGLFHQMRVPQARRIKREIEHKQKFRKLGVKFDVVKSASGGTVRAYVPVIIRIHKKQIATTVSIVDRSHLAYSAIIGAIDLGSFYINPV